jgi:hypothetical protein
MIASVVCRKMDVGDLRFGQSSDDQILHLLDETDSANTQRSTSTVFCSNT